MISSILISSSFDVFTKVYMCTSVYRTPSCSTVSTHGLGNRCVMREKGASGILHFTSYTCTSSHELYRVNKSRKRLQKAKSEQVITIHKKYYLMELRKSSQVQKSHYQKVLKSSAHSLLKWYMAVSIFLTFLLIYLRK